MAPAQGPDRSPGLSPFRQNAAGDWIIPEGDENDHHCRIGQTDANGVHHLCVSTYYASRRVLYEHMGGHGVSIEHRHQRAHAHQAALAHAPVQAQPQPAPHPIINDNARTVQPAQYQHHDPALIGGMNGGQMMPPNHHDSGQYPVMGGPPPQFSRQPHHMADPYVNPYSNAYSAPPRNNEYLQCFNPDRFAGDILGQRPEDNYNAGRRGPEHLDIFARTAASHIPAHLAPPNFGAPGMSGAPNFTRPQGMVGMSGPPNFGQHQQQPYHGLMRAEYQPASASQGQQNDFHFGGYGDVPQHDRTYQPSSNMMGRQHIAEPFMTGRLQPQQPYLYGPPARNIYSPPAPYQQQTFEAMNQNQGIRSPVQLQNFEHLRQRPDLGLPRPENENIEPEAKQEGEDDEIEERKR